MKQSIKRGLALALCLVLCAALLPGTASAAEIVDSGTCGENLTWELDSEGTLTISGTGAMRDYGGNIPNAPWYSKRDSIKAAKIKPGVTTIGSYAFFYCMNMMSVEIAESVTAIKTRAFSHCIRLNRPILSNGLVSIGSYAFYNCVGFTDLTIPANVTSIGDCAFSTCNNLTAFHVAADNPAFCSKNDVLFSKDGRILYCYPIGKKISSYSIPAQVDIICRDAFYNGKNLLYITIPDSVTSIGMSAFGETGYYNSSNNWSMEGVLYIGKHLIKAESNKLSTEYSILPGTKVIADYAFFNCKSLTEIAIPVSLESIGEGAFSNCSGLKSITVPAGMNTIRAYTFSDCNSLKRITIPGSVSAIKSFAFWGCKSLKDIFYHGSQTQWESIEIEIANEDLLNSSFHFSDSDSEHPLGQTQPNVIFEEEEAEAVAFLSGPADRSMTVYGVCYSVDHQFLNIVSVTLEAGQNSVLTVPFKAGSYIKLFATDASDNTPLCASVRVDRPA